MIRFYTALWCAKLIRLALKILGRNATYFAGKAAIKLCPDFLGRIGKPAVIIGVTGTNGKTTVNNMLTAALEALGVKVLSNRFGSNINAGIATALISGANLFGRTSFDIACLEMDERSARLIYPYIKPDFLIITNLFRDSMRRNAHPEYIAGILTEHIPRESKLVLNADDLISSCIAPLNERVYFGIDRLKSEGEGSEKACIVCDATLCPSCGERLSYDFRRYNHIGRAHCGSCGFASPEASCLVTCVDIENALLSLRYGNEDFTFRLSSDIIYNIYNQAAVICALFQMGYTPERVVGAFEGLDIIKSRYDRRQIGNKSLCVIMAKGQNAIACSRSFDYVSEDSGGRKAVVLMLDDVFDENGTSENIAWLYDADFEFLNTPEITQIITVGIRCRDSLLRLLIAGVPEERITALENEEEAADAVDYKACDSIFILYELYRQKQAEKMRDAMAERMGETIEN